jgi:Na+-driven multidrug efflux pump
MFKLGVPIALVQCLSIVMLVVANNAMARLGGERALAVIGIVNALSQLLIFPIAGIAQGAQALWGYNYGAGKLDRVRGLTKLTLVWTSILAVLFTLVLELFTRQFVAVFNPRDGVLYMAKNILSIAGMALLPLVLGLDGVFWTGPATDLISTILSALLLVSGLKNLKAKEAEPPGEQLRNRAGGRGLGLRDAPRTWKGRPSRLPSCGARA